VEVDAPDGFVSAVNASPAATAFPSPSLRRRHGPVRATSPPTLSAAPCSIG
jgi:hypothetical protein